MRVCHLTTKGWAALDDVEPEKARRGDGLVGRESGVEGLGAAASSSPEHTEMPAESCVRDAPAPLEPDGRVPAGGEPRS